MLRDMGLLGKSLNSITDALMDTLDLNDLGRIRRASLHEDFKSQMYNVRIAQYM